MNWDLLLYWMTHVGSGSWGTFRGAVAKLAGADAELENLNRDLRIFLSDLGHADFFIDDSQRWRILPPVLAGLSSSSGTAVLAGGRTPRLVEALTAAAVAHGCRLLADGSDERPARVRVCGAHETVAAAARDSGIPYEANFAVALCASIIPISQMIENAPVEQPLVNWTARSFDLVSLKWVEGLHDRAACEFRPRYGRSRFYLHTRKGRLLRLGKREAVYAAAVLRGLPLVAYDPAALTLSVPASAPLPEPYARVACLCDGAPPAVDRGLLKYRTVPHQVAAILLVAAGQAYPELRLPSSDAVLLGERPRGQSV